MQTEPPTDSAADTVHVKHRRGVIAVVFLTVLIDFIGFSILIPVLPKFADDLGATPFEVGVIGAIYAFAQLFFLPVWGWVSDRVGRRPVILVSLAGTVASLLLLAFASSLPAIYIARILGGFFAASVGTAQAVITDITPPSERAAGMGMIGASLGIAMILGPALGGILADLTSHVPPEWLTDPDMPWLPDLLMRMPFHFVAIVAALNLVLGIFILPETRSAKVDMPAWGELARSFIPTPVTLLIQTHNARIRLYLYLWFHVYLAFSALEIIFPLYMFKEWNATELDVGLLFMWIGLFIAISMGWLVGVLTRYVSEHFLVLAGMGLSGICLVAIPFTPTFAGFYLLGPLLAIGNGLAFPAFTSLYSQACEARDAGELLGQGNSMGVAGRVVGPILAGYLMQRVGPATPFVVSGLLMIGGLVIIQLFRGLLLGRKEPENLETAA